MCVCFFDAFGCTSLFFFFFFFRFVLFFPLRTAQNGSQNVAAVLFSALWSVLQNGIFADAWCDHVRKGSPAVQEMHAFGVKDLFVTLDVTDHLDRSSEAPELIALNRSITEPDVQMVYASFARAVSQLLQPNALGLAAETNFIRKAAKTEVWKAVGKRKSERAIFFNIFEKTKLP
jgi:hypothetical protein